jgi:hypothetical protein
MSVLYGFFVAAGKDTPTSVWPSQNRLHRVAQREHAGARPRLER